MLKFSCKNLQFQKLRTNYASLLLQDENQTVGCLVFALGGEYRCSMWLVNFIAPSCPHPSKVQPSVTCYTSLSSVQFSSVQSLSCVRLFVTPWMQHTRLPCTLPTPEACSNSCSSSQWCHSTISSSVIPLSSCLQSCPVSGSFQMSRFFPSGDQNIGVSASTSVLPMNTQDWAPLEWTGWISLQSQGLSRVFSNTTVQKRQFFSAQPSL